jgi:hypothetical protein
MIYFIGCGLDGKTLTLLFKFLKHKSTIRMLYLEDSPLSDNDLSCAFFEEFLAETPHLTKLFIESKRQTCLTQ